MADKTYLGVKARLSQAWLASPLLIMIFYITKLILLQKVIQATLQAVKQLTISECQNLDMLVQTAIQARQEAILAANKLVESTINASSRALKNAMGVTVTAVENLILFALQMTLGTYSCLTISAVNVASNEALNATESVVKVANSAAQDIGKDLNKGLEKLSEFISSAEGLISTVDHFVTGSTTDLNAINSTVNKLNDMHIPSNVNTKLESSRKDIPTYESTREAVSEVIKKPFQDIRQHLNQSNATISFSSRSLSSESASPYVPQCDFSSISRSFRKFERDIDRIIWVSCGICAVSICFGIIFNLWKTHSNWKRLARFANSDEPFAGKLSTSRVECANVERILFAESRWIERWILLKLPPKSWWLVRYMTATPLREYLIIGLAGISISLIELRIINMLHDVTKFLRDIENQMLATIRQNMNQDYSTWSTEVNSRISTTEVDVNNDWLGWIYHGSQDVNNSIATFMSHINTDIANTFNNTPFSIPMQDVVNCLIGDKVKTIERGLSWIHENAQVTLPRVPLDLFANSSSYVPDKIENMAKTVMESAVSVLQSQIKTQLIVSGVLVAVWCILVVSAILYARRESLIAFTKPFTSSLNGSKPSELCTPNISFSKNDGCDDSHENSINKSSGDKSARPLKRKPYPPSLIVSGFPKKHTDMTSPRIIPSPYSHCHSAQSVNIQSPIEIFGNRITKFFMGPAKPPSFDVIQSPQKASIVLPETPRTPLRAMLF